MQTELKHIQRQTGTTFLYVTHDQEEALTMSDRIAVLNRGVCAQCDRPERLFSRPRTRFVATFFRGCNVLEADLLGVAESVARVRTGGCEVSLAVPGGSAPGSNRPAVAIRGERVRVGSAAEGCPVRWRALLRDVIYRGTNVDYVLELEDGQRLVATSTRREVEGGDQWITAGTDVNDVILLED